MSSSLRWPKRRNVGLVLAGAAMQLAMDRAVDSRALSFSLTVVAALALVLGIAVVESYCAWRRLRVAVDAAGRPPAPIHYMQHGATPCGIVPPNWPDGPSWSADRAFVTCSRCLAGLGA